MLPTMMRFVGTMIGGYARSYATNHGGLCMATDNGVHVVSLPTMMRFVGTMIWGYARSSATNYGENLYDKCIKGQRM